MHFEKGYTYHIYNRGNNRQRIFFNHRNYLFFIEKMKEVKKNQSYVAIDKKKLVQIW